MTVNEIGQRFDPPIPRIECYNRWEDGCRNHAHYLIAVPWINVFTREEGADWTPFCGACAIALDEDWETKPIQGNN